MVALLALVAVVAYMAKAGLPWWVVALVTVLMAGFVGGMSWSPNRGPRGIAARGPAGRPGCARVPGGAARRRGSAHEVGLTCVITRFAV